MCYVQIMYTTTEIINLFKWLMYFFTVQKLALLKISYYYRDKQSPVGVL